MEFFFKLIVVYRLGVYAEKHNINGFVVPHLSLHFTCSIKKLN